MNLTIDPQALPYIAAVRARLSGIAGEDLEEIVADLELHLAEMLSEGAEPLRDRLGTPDNYADELTYSAGWNDTAFRRPFMLRVSDWAKRFTATGLGGWLWELGMELRPGWWVARGLMVPMIWSALYTGKVFSGIHWVILGLMGSVALGFRARRTRAWRLGSWIATRSVSISTIKTANP